VNKSNTYPILELDGRRLYYTFVAGAKKLFENQSLLNQINVFPVNDGDTGTNLASTIRSVLEQTRPERSYKITADKIAEAALLNAQGNSGIIFAQFLYGISAETDGLDTIGLIKFSESIKKSVKYIYEAIANPVEGTMLTVIREWAEYIHLNREHFLDFGHLLTSSQDILKKSLAETKSKLDILTKSNVVDAGAKGFVLFIEGILEFVKSNNIKSLLRTHTENILPLKREEIVPQSVIYRYCTEAIIKNSNIDKMSLAQILEQSGDSVVVAGSEKIRHIHVHTNTPANLFANLQKSGTLSSQKAEDMVRQSEVAYNRKWNIALVTDSTCDLPDDLLDQYQINMLPLNLNFGENQYLDKITIKPEHFYTLLDESPFFPKTAQINEKSFTNLYSQLASHYDSIIAVHLTDKFSGTFFNSQKAAQKVGEEFKKQITVINSKNLSGGLGLITLRIAQTIESGMPYDQIITATEKWIKDTNIFVSVKTLKYMIRGGRVSRMKGSLANLLNVNPIVSMNDDGKSHIFGKTYSQKSNMIKVIEHIKTMAYKKNIWNYMVLHAHNETAANWYTEEMKTITGKTPVSVINISPVIGMNAGIGAAAVALMLD
jgi:DegV family protein with EDD domain